MVVAAFLADEQQRDRQYADGDGPEQTVPAGRMGAFRQVAGRRRRQAVGSGVVGRGDEDDGHEREDHERQGAERQETDRLSDRVVVAGRLGDFPHRQGARQIEVHAVVAEDSVEDGAAESAQDQHPEDQLPHRPAARDAGHEQAHEGSVGDPPRPVEDSHVLDEPRSRHRVGPGVEPDEVPEHQADRVRARAQQEVGRADHEHEGQQDDRRDDGAVGEGLDAAFESQVDADREQDDADGEDRHLESERLLDAEHLADAGGDHRRAEPERRARAADHCQDEQDVDDAGGGTVVPLAADQGVQAGAQAQGRGVLAVVGDGDRHRREAVQRPGRDAPVEDAVGRRPLDRLGGVRGEAEGWRIEVGDPLDRRPVEQPRADAGAEQHGHPTEETEVRPAVFGPEPFRSVAAEGEPDQEHGDCQRRPLVEQSEALRQRLVGPDDQGAAGLRRQRQRNADQGDQRGTDAEGDAIDAWWAGRHSVGC